MARILLTGASGVLGRAIKKELTTNSDWSVLGLGYQRVFGDLQKCDLTNKDEVIAIFESFKPTFVIHAAAERRPDQIEGNPKAASNLNILATEQVCNLAMEYNAVVLFISTDYVFDGSFPPYSHTDTPNPLNTYGRLKLQGEQITLAANSKNLVLRVAMLYGYVSYLNESPVTCLFPKAMDLSTTSYHDDYLRRYPTHVDDLAHIIRLLLKRKSEDEDLKGIFQWNGNECYTKFGMAREMTKVFGLTNDHLKPFKSESDAKRPHDCQLLNNRLENLNISKYSKFSESIKMCMESHYSSTQ